MRKIGIIACGFFVLAGLTLMAAGVQARTNRGVGVSPEDLPKSLRDIDIKDWFIPSSFKKAGVIHALRGHVVVIHKATGQAYFGKEGDYIYENDSINTLTESRCRIKLKNDDIATMASNSEFSVDTYRADKKKRSKTSIFGMLKGKVKFYALRLFRYRKANIRVKTPTAIVGVRGTSFGVHVYYEDEDNHAEAGVRVADAGEKPGIYLARTDPGGGGKSYTDAHCEDGELGVNGKSVPAGSMYNGKTGDTGPTPPGYVRQFQSETEVGGGGGGEGDGEGDGEGEGEDVTGTGDGTDPGDQADQTEDQSQTTQEQTGTETTQTQTPDDISEGKILGEGSAVTTIITSGGAMGSAILGEGEEGPIYMSHEPNNFTGGAETHTAYNNDHEGDDAFKMVLQEQSETDMGIKVTYFDWGDGENQALETPHYFAWHDGGHYNNETGHDYLSWGWWEDTDTADFGHIAGAASYYAAGAHIWEIEGDRTHPDYIDYLQQQNFSATYSGEANGVFADSCTPNVKFLNGNFSCHVDFGSRDVTNFNIDVGHGGPGGDHQVHINNAIGTIASDGQFEVDAASGTINGASLTGEGAYGGAGGVFFGKKAQGVGGIWEAHSGDYWATGEFHGKR